MKKSIKLPIYIFAIVALVALTGCTSRVQTVTDISEVDENTSINEQETGPLTEESDLETIENELVQLEEELDDTLPSVNDDDFE